MDVWARDKQLVRRWLLTARQQIQCKHPPVRRGGPSLDGFDRHMAAGRHLDAASVLMTLARDCVTDGRFATTMALVADLLGLDETGQLEAA